MTDFRSPKRADCTNSRKSLHAPAKQDTPLRRKSQWHGGASAQPSKTGRWRSEVVHARRRQSCDLPTSATQTMCCKSYQARSPSLLPLVARQRSPPPASRPRADSTQRNPRPARTHNFQKLCDDRGRLRHASSKLEPQGRSCWSWAAPRPPGPSPCSWAGPSARRWPPPPAPTKCPTGPTSWTI